MPSPIRTIETDVCIVGAGMIGLAHAHAARRRGLSVVLLERGACASGASVRHSGHLFFSALPAGDALAAASHARERWLELTQRAGTPARAGGTLILAHRDDELAVLEAAAAEPQRQARMRSRKRIGKLAPVPVEDVLGAFHAKQDLSIDPRSTPAALARLLSGDPGARVEWGAHVHEIEPGTVHAGALRVRADATVVCAGAGYRMLPPELWPQRTGLTLRQTQMLRVRGPHGRRFRQALSTGAGLLAYPGFCALEAIAPLRERLELESPELIERGVSLVVTQLDGGDLIIGGTATYSERPRPFSRERLDALVLAQARSVLGFAPEVRQRWCSTQVSRPGTAEDFLTTRPMPGVRVVQAVGATAMALCHVYAEKVLDELLAGPPSVDLYISVRDMREATTRAGGVRRHARAFGPRNGRQTTS